MPWRNYINSGMPQESEKYSIRGMVGHNRHARRTVMRANWPWYSAMGRPPFSDSGGT
jgi:hypothetical protein